LYGKTIEVTNATGVFECTRYKGIIFHPTNSNTIDTTEVQSNQTKPGMETQILRDILENIWIIAVIILAVIVGIVFLMKKR